MQKKCLKKFKILKFNCPSKELINDEVHAHKKSVSQKLRKVGSSVNESIHSKNNLSVNERVA